MRFKAIYMLRNDFYYRYYCQLSEQDAVQAFPTFMPRGAQQIVHHQLDNIEACRYVYFDTSVLNLTNWVRFNIKKERHFVPS